MRIALVRTALGAALAALLLTLAPVGIASASSDIGPGINSFYNNRCLDADLGTIGGNGTVVQLWDCAGAWNQLWYLSETPWSGVYKIHSWYNGRCLDADLGSIGGNGTRIQLWDCGGDYAHNQNWYFTNTPWGGVQKIHSFYNDRCLDADLGTIGGNGTRIQLWDCAGDFWHNQNWYGS